MVVMKTGDVMAVNFGTLVAAVRMMLLVGDVHSVERVRVMVNEMSRSLSPELTGIGAEEVRLRVRE